MVNRCCLQKLTVTTNCLFQLTNTTIHVLGSSQQKGFSRADGPFFKYFLFHFCKTSCSIITRKTEEPIKQLNHFNATLAGLDWSARNCCRENPAVPMIQFKMLIFQVLWILVWRAQWGFACSTENICVADCRELEKVCDPGATVLPYSPLLQILQQLRHKRLFSPWLTQTLDSQLPLLLWQGLLYATIGYKAQEPDCSKCKAKWSHHCTVMQRAHMSRQLRSFGKVAIQVGNSHHLQRGSTPRFLDFSVKNIVWLVMFYRKYVKGT